jgi:hypothetical protein
MIVGHDTRFFCVTNQEAASRRHINESVSVYFKQNYNCAKSDLMQSLVSSQRVDEVIAS